MENISLTVGSRRLIAYLDVDNKTTTKLEELEVELEVSGGFFPLEAELTLVHPGRSSSKASVSISCWTGLVQQSLQCVSSFFSAPSRLGAQAHTLLPPL